MITPPIHLVWRADLSRTMVKETQWAALSRMTGICDHGQRNPTHTGSRRAAGWARPQFRQAAECGKEYYPKGTR